MTCCLSKVLPDCQIIFALSVTFIFFQQNKFITVIYVSVLPYVFGTILDRNIENMSHV